MHLVSLDLMTSHSIQYINIIINWLVTHTHRGSQTHDFNPPALKRGGGANWARAHWFHPIIMKVESVI